MLRQALPSRQDPKHSLCTGLQACELDSAWDFSGLVCGKSASWGVCFVWGFLWFVPRGKALTPGLQGLISVLLDVGLEGRPGGLRVYGGKAKLLGRRWCLCQNLIINPPCCEKWVSPELLFLRQRSSAWSQAPSSPPWGCVALALGVAAVFLRWGLPLSWASSVPSIFSITSLTTTLRLEAPSQPLGCHLQTFLRVPGLGCVPLCPG